MDSILDPACIAQISPSYYTLFSPLSRRCSFQDKHFVCLFGFLTSSSTTRLYRGRAPRQERLTILRAATHETELGDHDFCLSRSHYTVTDPTCRERAATAGIEPGTSSPGVARSTVELPRPPQDKHKQKNLCILKTLPMFPAIRGNHYVIDRHGYPLIIFLLLMDEWMYG